MGITVSPGRVYYHLPPGSSTSERIVVSNPTDGELEIGVSISDWCYDSVGNNIGYEARTLKTSCADWVQVMPGSYFTLRPREQKTLDLLMQVPAAADTTVPVHTALLYVTQLNHGTATTNTGAAIRVTVRMGVKLYHSFRMTDEKDVEIKDFADREERTPAHLCKRYLDLQFNNTGKSWIEGTIKWELFNEQSGQKTKLDPTDFYSLPGDSRLVRKELPGDLKKGKYNATAIINYGNKDELKIAELEFEF
ncbi:hypothetical protein [Arcticibacter sp. MXS-1]|uniref:hypothetical protein n=1 Tax=Arcticibacter sp. MXS-1 TaxID=3341726 RepID=UPI0035A91361